MKVILDRRVLTNFRRRAWARFPKEYMEALFGHKRGDTFYITMFYDFPHSSTIWHCNYEKEDVDRLCVEAENLGLEYLGEIHTHTGLKTCEHASKADHLEAIDDGDALVAVLYLHRSGKSTSRLNFYIPSEPIKITYV